MSYGLFLVGLVLIVLGGHLMVKHASSVARYMGISDWVIAVTIVAAGTSAPEFATSVSAAMKGRHGIAIGNLIGSDLFNLLGVLGLAGMINPSIIGQDIFNSVFLLVLMVGLTLLLIRTNWRISRLEGTLLVTINLVRWYFDFAN
jgi:cation:H+ antiporter